VLCQVPVEEAAAEPQDARAVRNSFEPSMAAEVAAATTEQLTEEL